ncbi:MAG TPA: hypothetical protein PK264_15995 [Hyphomicrobiaceae bacterium]|nr:hypothetical protein [Hyphomicrobiaceae bacterium]
MIEACRSLLRTALLVMLAFLIVDGSATAQPAKRKVVVMIDDGPTTSENRGSPLAHAVRQVVARHLLADFEVVEEMALGLPSAPDGRRTSESWSANFKALSGKADILVRVQVHTIVEQVPFAGKIPQYRATFRLSLEGIAVESGAVLNIRLVGPFELSSLPESCKDGSCLVNLIPRESVFSANDFARDLAKKGRPSNAK